MMARYYKKNGYELPRITMITGQLDKPALTRWSAGCACDYIIEGIQKSLDQIKHEFFIKKNIPKTKSEIIIYILRYVNGLYPIIEAARKNFQQVSAKALNIGSKVHDAIAQYLKTGREPFNPEDAVLSAFIAFLEWKDQHEIETLATEFTVYGPDYAGTADWLLILNGKKYIIDFKSSSGIYPEMRYQIAGYRSTDPTIEGCGILRLDKETGQPEWKDTSDSYDADLDVFFILTDLWWVTHPRKRAQFLKNGGSIYARNNRVATL